MGDSHLGARNTSSFLPCLCGENPSRHSFVSSYVLSISPVNPVQQAPTPQGLLTILSLSPVVAVSAHSTGAGFLSLAVVVWVWVLLCCSGGGCPVRGRRCSSIPPSTHWMPVAPIIPAVTTENVSGHCQMSPGGQNCTQGHCIGMSYLGVSALREGHPLDPQCWNGASHREGTGVLWRKTPDPWAVPVGSRH